MEKKANAGRIDIGIRQLYSEWVDVRRLTERDAEPLWRLRLNALVSEPEAFAESLEEHLQTPIEEYANRLRLGGEENFVIGAFSDSILVGMAGFYRELRLKRRHRGWIWGMYVAPSGRRLGFGAALLQEVLTRARSQHGLRCVLLSVTNSQAAARRLYANAGFRPLGIEPEALMVGEKYIDQEHMALRV